jgi:glycosyltransferase involved in cell wall biosynthesis
MEARRVSEPSSPRFPGRLGVLTHVPHWIGADGEPWAYEPYVREMRVWAELFEEVEICAPRGEAPMSGNQAPYARANIRWVPVSYHQGTAPASPLKRLAQLPGVFAAARRTARRSRLLHLRSPGHFALAGALLCRLSGRATLSKWAGENGPFPGERLPSRFQRWLEGIPSRRHPVLVYGPSRKTHQIEFLPALMTGPELARAAELSRSRLWQPPWQLLSVARLERVKNLELAIRGLGLLRRRRPELDWRYVIVGDGPLRAQLALLAQVEGIADRVRFDGARAFSEVQARYAEAHVVIMPGVKEGWPKVIAEAWAHGALALAASAGIVPWILAEGKRGVAFPAAPEGLAGAVEALLADPSRMEALAREASQAARGISLEDFRDRLEQVISERCGLD